MIDTEPYFLSWQGKILGPHDLGEIREMLRRGEINSLYKIQIGKQWELLRDYLPRIERASREAARVAEAIVVHPPAPSPPPPVVRVVSDEDDAPPSVAVPMASSSDTSKGAALTSFVLSLLFFIPGLNLIAWVLGLLSGHMALDQQKKATTDNVSQLRAWFGVRMCYIMGASFLLQGSILSMMDFSAFVHQSLILTLHLSLLGTALAALVVAAFLLAGLRLLTGSVAMFSRCYIAAILSCSLGGLTTGFVSGLLDVDLASGTRQALGVALLALGIQILVLGAACFRIVRLRDGVPVRAINAAVASFFSWVLTAILFLIYMFIFGML